jgi:hypothetical protein
MTEQGLNGRILTTEASVGAQNYAKELLKFVDPNAPPLDEVNNVDIERINGLLEYAQKQADDLELQSVHDRIDLFRRKLRWKMSLHDFLAEVRALREAFESGLNFKRFYLYPEAKAKLCIRFEGDWEQVISGFPQTREDAQAAVDCYGLGHNTASVFHSMRVVEHGLREMAKAVNVTFDIQSWHTIIEAIESEIRDIDRRWRQSTGKSEWMSFYSEAAKEFFYFKAGWRNYVSHGGEPYDEHQSLSVLEHVRTFMTHLGSRLGAQPS